MKWIKRWWGDSDAEFNEYLELPYFPPHWSAKCVRSLLRSFQRDWKWWLMFVAGLAAIVLKRK
jgi:hypothetical protein